MKVTYELDTERDDPETVERFAAAVYPEPNNHALVLFKVAQMLRELNKHGTAEGIALSGTTDRMGVPEEITDLIDQIYTRFFAICESYDVDPFGE